jgi:GNAT superfamily N-acetyltransferase
MTRNNADFHNLTFNHENLFNDEVVVTANHPNHGEIAHLHLSKHNGLLGGRVVLEVQTAAPFQRKGIATKLWNYAEDNGLNPLHSTTRTTAGDAWAKKVGGYLPPNEDWQP